MSMKTLNHVQRWHLEQADIAEQDKYPRKQQLHKNMASIIGAAITPVNKTQQSPKIALTGQRLYELWLAKRLQIANCKDASRFRKELLRADRWDQLQEFDQQVWDAMAAALEERAG